MAGRPRTPISTGGTIRTRKVDSGVFRAITVFRDWDGQNRKLVASDVSRNAAEAALKADLTARLRSGGVGDSLNASSPFVLLAQAWMEDVAQNVDRSQGTKDTYQRELRTLILPFFDNFTIREVTVGRVELFLKQQRGKSYARAKHSRVMLGMVMAFAVRREIVDRNPVKEASRMKQPPHTPKALTMEQIAAIRLAATRIGEALALRHCDVDITADPPRVTISGTIVVHTGAGMHRQEHPKTHESNRVISIPRFAADVIRERLALLDVEDTEHLLFFTRVGTPLTPFNVRRTFRGILRNAGLEGLEISPHSFRRTGAALLAHELGMQAAADMLGHTSTSTTKAHYAESDRTVKSGPAEVMQKVAPPKGGVHSPGSRPAHRGVDSTERTDFESANACAQMSSWFSNSADMTLPGSCASTVRWIRSGRHW